MSTLFARPILRWGIHLHLLALCALTAPMASAQLDGDGFADGEGKGYYFEYAGGAYKARTVLIKGNRIEFPVAGRACSIPITGMVTGAIGGQTAAASTHRIAPSHGGSIKTASTPSQRIDEFAESANDSGKSAPDPFVDSPDVLESVSATQIAASQGETVSPRAVPMLRGATSGTMGPQGRSSMMYTQPDSYLRIVFTTPRPSAGRVYSALRDLSHGISARAFGEAMPPWEQLSDIYYSAWNVDYVVREVSTPVKRTVSAQGKTTLSAVLKAARELETRPVMRTLRYKVYAGQSTMLLAEVYGEEAPDAVLASLYSRAAQLERRDLWRHIYSGKAALFRRDRALAWRHFQGAYLLASDDAKVAREVAEFYGRFSGRDIERCVWLNRYLRVAPDWASFERTDSELEAIEQKWSADEILHERGPNAAWADRPGPLLVCFPGSSATGYDKRLIETFNECLRDWIIAAGCKFDYALTNDPQRADIICQWHKPLRRCDSYKYEGSAPLPVETPRLPRRGLTEMILDTSKGTDLHLHKASIRIYAEEGSSLRLIDDGSLRAVCLHELGHALGIRKHLANRSSVMYPYHSDENPNLDLALEDMSAMADLYDKHPVNEAAVGRFTGMRAVCKKLDLQNLISSMMLSE